MTSLESNGERSPSNHGFASVNSNGAARGLPLERPRSEHVPACMQTNSSIWNPSAKRRSDSATSTFASRPTHFPGWEAATEAAKSKNSTREEDEEEEEEEKARSDLREEMVACGHPVTLYREEVYLTAEACRGFLDKMGGRFKTWRRRWFVFDREREELRYYLNQSENRLKGAVSFAAMSDVYVNSNPPRHYRSPNRRLTFCLGTPGRTFYLVADSSEVMRMWIEVMLTAVLNRNTLRPT